MGRFVRMSLLGVLIAAGLCLWAWLGYVAIDWAGSATFELGWGATLGQAAAAIVFLQLLFVMILATLLMVAERKWSAAIQDRIGPNRARLPGLSRFSLGGIPHVLADAVKMLSKEDFLPSQSSRVLYHLAPVLNFAPIFCLFAIVPMGPPVPVRHAFGVLFASLQIANPDAGLLYLFAIASLAVYGVALAGWASGNKLALLGGVRAASQMVAYEVALGLGLVGMMMTTGTLRLDAMIQSQSAGLFGTSWFPAWGLFVQPVGFLLFFAAAFAETKRTPFDLPEGESEIIGYFLEYSGMKFGMFMMAEFVEIITLSGVVTAVFLGGWHLSPVLDDALASAAASLVAWRFAGPPDPGAAALTLAVFQAALFAVKVIVLCWLQLAIRWTFPRFRYDQVQALGWRFLLPLGLVNVFATGVCLLLDSSLGLLGALGLAEIALVVGATLWSSSRPAALPVAAAGGH